MSNTLVFAGQSGKVRIKSRTERPVKVTVLGTDKAKTLVLKPAA